MTRSNRVRTPFIERLFAGHHNILAALRSLRRSPGFVAIAVVSLGLGIALTTTTFALLDAIRRPYVPYTDPGTLYWLGFYAEARDAESMVRDMYFAIKPRHDLYAALVPEMYMFGGGAIETNGRLIAGGGSWVGAGMLDVLGVKPFLGRAFNRHPDDPADQGSAMVSYQLWHDELGADPHLEHLRVTYDGQTYAVIGVLPPGVDVGGSLWLPMSAATARTGLSTGTGLGRISTVIRLHSGDSQVRVKAQLNAISASFIANRRPGDGLFDYRLEPMGAESQSVGGFPILVALATSLILVLACLNLANLMLVRGLGRRREIAMRMALGASRTSIVRYVLTECALLAGLGGAWGILLSVWGVSLARAHMPTRIASLGLVAPRLDWRVVAFGIALTVMTVAVSGALPAIRAARANVHDAMKDGGTSSAGHRSRSYRLVVVLEIALALFVTMGSSFALQSLRRASAFQFSYDADHQLSAFISITRGCQATDTVSRFWRDMATRAEAVRGVRYAAVSMRTFPKQSTITSDQPGAPTEIFLGEGQVMGYNVVTPDYFRAFGFPIIAGRDFEVGDADGSGVAIVNRRTAARLWPFVSPVGRLLKLGPAKSDAPWVRVVGVVGPRRTAAGDSTVDVTPDLTVVRHAASLCSVATLYARTTGNPEGPAVALYHVVRAAVPAGALVTVFSPSTAEAEQNLRVTRLIAFLSAIFGIFAIALSCVGVYGVLNYAIGQRSREFATRAALGAGAPHLRKIVLTSAAEMVLGGTALGATTALVGAYSFFALDSGVGVATLVTAEIVIVAATLVASIGPVRRALRADLVELLRAT